MRVAIRIAEREDAPTIINMVLAFAGEQNAVVPDLDACVRLLDDGWSSSPRFTAWLAEVNQLPIGYALTLDTYSSFLARPTLYIEDLYVVPEYRNRGVGTALLQWLNEEAVSRGYGRIEWTCAVANAHAFRLYERLGARPAHRQLIRLTPGANRSLDCSAHRQETLDQGVLSDLPKNHERNT